jgi:hypothetical protein
LNGSDKRRRKTFDFYARCVYIYQGDREMGMDIISKREYMGRIIVRYEIMVLVLLLFCFSSLVQAEIKEIKAEDLVGTETLNFYLSSTEDRLIHYGDDYYGKYYLVLTFFPAAFTPV